MKYVLESISTVQACDVLLAGAKKKKQSLERRVRNLGESLVTFRKRLDQVHQQSAEVQSSLAVFTVAYGSLSEGKDKVNMNIRIKRLELHRPYWRKKPRLTTSAPCFSKKCSITHSPARYRRWRITSRR